MRAKQTKICDAEWTGFPTPMFIHLTQPHGFACQPLRGLVTSRQRRVLNYLQSDWQTSLTAVFRTSMKLYIYVFLTVRNRQNSLAIHPAVKIRKKISLYVILCILKMSKEIVFAKTEIGRVKPPAKQQTNGGK